MAVAVYFDLDGTLVGFDREYEAIVEAAIESVVGRVESGWADAVGGFFRDHFRAFDDDPYRQAVADLHARQGFDADPDAVAEAWVATERAASELRPGVEELLDRLAGRDEVSLGVVTNGVPAVQRGKLREHDLIDRFESVVISYEVGAHKPDAAMFEAARERIDAGEYVLVGDDLEGDVVPAEEQGFTGVHVDDGLGAAARVGSVEDLDAVTRLL